MQVLKASPQELFVSHNLNNQPAIDLYGAKYLEEPDKIPPIPVLHNKSINPEKGGILEVLDKNKLTFFARSMLEIYPKLKIPIMVIQTAADLECLIRIMEPPRMITEELIQKWEDRGLSSDKIEKLKELILKVFWSYETFSKEVRMKLYGINPQFIGRFPYDWKREDSKIICARDNFNESSKFYSSQLFSYDENATGYIFRYLKGESEKKVPHGRIEASDDDSFLSTCKKYSDCDSKYFLYKNISPETLKMLGSYHQPECSNYNSMKKNEDLYDVLFALIKSIGKNEYKEKLNKAIALSI